MPEESLSSPDMFVYTSGVVTLGRDPSARVLSCLATDAPIIADQRMWNLQGIWNPSAREEIRLNLTIHGREWLEGSADPPFDFSNRIGKVHPSTDAALLSCLGTSRYYFWAAHTHLRSLLRAYAKLTTIVGPRLPFNDATGSIIFHVPAPDCYAYFDACLVALRAFADSIRFTVWNILGRECGMPRNIAKLANADLPGSLAECLQKYIDGPLDEIQRYRDNAVHYAPLAVRDNTLLIWSNRIINAEIWIPINPEVRAHDQFEYEQKDAFRAAKHLLERTIEFADEFYTVIGNLRSSVVNIAHAAKE